jgi:hypothetical protein
VHFSRLDVIGSQNSHTGPQRGFVKISCVLVLLLENKKLGHHLIDVDVHRVVGTPVVVKDLARQIKGVVRLLRLLLHVISLHKEAVELDGDGVHVKQVLLQVIKSFIGHAGY